ncbi:glycosyltransferase [Aequorivita viscosa]|nr:glycosyltransferase [Aequorivita viscosa]
MISAFLILFVAYFLCMMALFYGFKKVPLFFAKDTNPATRFSVVIPFRNEAENLPNLLKSVEGINFPSEMFEIIFVNDASDDISEAIISETLKSSKLSIKLLQNKRVSNSPKKDAISEAIKNAQFEWIVTTDADCKLPKTWLQTIDAFIQKEKPVMVCGPVIYEANGSFIENFQQLDGFSLQAVTIGSFGFKNPLLSNGANLVYRKDAFLKVNGFLGNDHIASGDDIFLLEKMKKAFPKQVSFLKSKETIVITKPQKSWKDVVNQRIRWASKTSKQKSAISLLLGMLVFLVNISVLVLPLFIIFDSENFIVYLALLCFKITTDYVVVWQSAQFFGEKISFWKFLWQPFLYAAIVVAVVFRSFSGTYSWKGRTFKKVQQTN